MKLVRKVLNESRTVLINDCSLATSLYMCTSQIPSWQRGVVVSEVRRINEVNARRARLLPGWVTVFGQVYHLRF